MKKIFQKILKERFRITFFHDDFKPVFSLRFTVFTFILYIIGFATAIIIMTIYLIAKTSLKEYIPGYGTTEEKKQIMNILYKVDSLENILNNKNIYLHSILNAFNNKEDSSALKKKNSIKSNELNKNLTASENEKQIRQELSHAFLNSNNLINQNYDLPNFNFFPPTKGIFISKFNPSEGHYGIDIAGKNEDPVRSIFKGIVLYAGYTMTDGNFVIILHPNGFLSVYKHLSIILKSTGSPVTTNEIIGTMGNTGTESNGTHLHFELWNYETPQNPLDFMTI